MSSILAPRTILAGAATALFFGLAFSASAQAGTTSQLSQCTASSRGAAVACCQEVIRTYGAPGWMSGRTNCNRETTCGKKSGKYKCWIDVVLLYEIKEHTKDEKPSKGRSVN